MNMKALTDWFKLSNQQLNKLEVSDKQAITLVMLQILMLNLMMVKDMIKVIQIMSDLIKTEDTNSK